MLVCCCRREWDKDKGLAEQSVQVTLDYKPVRCSFAVAELYKYKRELDEGTDYSWDTCVLVTP